MKSISGHKVAQLVRVSAAAAAALAALLGTVPGIHTGAAQAQQTHRLLAQYPPPYAPPPGYGAPPPAPPVYRPPPPRYSYYYYAPPPPPPPPPAPRSDRPFTLGGSLGLGALRYHSNFDDASWGFATGYSLRLGFGLAPHLSFLLGIDGAVVSNADTFVYDQTIYYVGAQVFLLPRLFLRGGVGLANISKRDDSNFLAFGKEGFGLTGTVGVELLQGYNWSLELGWMLTAGFYKDETWTSSTINLGFNFF